VALWDDILIPIGTALGGWFGNTWKYAGERKQKEAELDQRDAELAQGKADAHAASQRWQSDHELELIEKARALLASDNEKDRDGGRMYLMGLIRVGGSNPLVDELLNSLAQQEFGQTLDEVRSAGDDALVVVEIVNDSDEAVQDVVVELVEEDDEPPDRG
jgi:hypothetical protein